MKFRKFKQNKLWRDGVVDQLELDGSKIHWTRLDDEPFAEELMSKLIEEVHEILTAQTKENLIEELADVLEVMTSMASLYGSSLEEIIDQKNKKHQEKGGFQGRKYVTPAEHLPGSPGEKYCLANPEKYPEV